MMDEQENKRATHCAWLLNTAVYLNGLSTVHYVTVEWLTVDVDRKVFFNPSYRHRRSNVFKKIFIKTGKYPRAFWENKHIHHFFVNLSFYLFVKDMSFPYALVTVRSMILIFMPSPPLSQPPFSSWLPSLPVFPAVSAPCGKRERLRPGQAGNQK